MTPDLIAGRYQVLRPVGRGGMGTVWLCRDEVLGREVAVKQISALPGETATDAARALREARSSAALNHHNVVSVFDVVDTDDGQAWLVMEYVPSRTLGQIIREDGPLGPRRAARIGAQVADGLAAAHALGTVHRDVKPGNILVGEDDRAKISDFGIARGADDEQLTRTGLVTGTPSYFSPELARGEDPGPESDVYALGATLYTAVEGHAPYPEQRNPIALLQKIAAEAPPPPTHAGILTAAIDRMMDRDTRSRWTMADAASALRRLAQAGPAGDEGTTMLVPPTVDSLREPAPVPAATQPPRDPEGRHRPTLPWLVGAVVLLLALLGGGYLALSGGTGQAPQAAPADPGSAKPSPTRTRGSSSSPSSGAKSHHPEKKSHQGSPDTSGTRSPRDPAQAMERFVADYFALMPDNTDAGWRRLAPSMKAQGRDSYEGWWSGVESVDLQQTDAVRGQRQVDIVLTYHFDDGTAKQESQRLTLDRSGRGYLIADDEVRSSRTVS